MISLNEFKRKNADSCLTAAQSKTISGGGTIRQEQFNTNADSGFGHDSDWEVWGYPDAGGPAEWASVYWFNENGGISGRPIALR